MQDRDNYKNILIFFLLLVLVSPGISQPYFIETYVETDERNLMWLDLADMNNDGLFDIVLFDSLNVGLVVLENAGDGSFIEHFQEQTHSMNLYGNIKTGDLEGDGDLDVFVSGSSDEYTIVWFENQGDFRFEEHPLHHGSHGFETISDFVPFDADDDGDLDFLVAEAYIADEDCRIVVLINNDNTEFPVTGYVRNFVRTCDIMLADFDLDGDWDVIASYLFDEGIYFYRNDGAYPFTEIELMGFGNNILFQFPEIIFYDNDEIPDILTTYNFMENIYVCEINNEELNVLEIIETSFNTTNSITYVDLDQDGDMDLLGNVLPFGYVVWWERDGNNFIEHLIGDGISTNLKAYDIDNDGNLEIVGQSTGHLVSIWEQVPPCSITLIPHNEWQVIFPVGGILSFDVNLQSFAGTQLQGFAWTEIITPGGLTIGPLASYQLELDALEFFEVASWLDVPGWVPGGYYTFVANIGPGLNNPIDSDSLVFLKMGTDPNAGEFDNWATTGWNLVNPDEEFVSLEFLPGEYAIENIYPNPFNPRTEITVKLPESSHLQLEVYDILGRQVMTLADGHFSDGNHKFTFDGTGLSSGVYLVKMNVPGKFSSMEKVVLMK